MDLLAWAKENGTEVQNVSIESSTESGLLLRATQDIQPGSNIVSCSYKTTLSYLNVALNSASTAEAFPADFVKALEIEDPNIIGHFFLVQQYLLGSRSFWWPYIQLLPQPDQPEKLGIPILWPEEDFKFLIGTNSEPPVRQRRGMWQDEWKRGVGLLQNHSEREKYTYDLYQWAAVIFGSRSFRASLTVPEDQIRNSNVSEEQKTLILDHVRVDRFSVLLPLLDLGNHNGVNEVEWSQDPKKGVFTLSNREFIPEGSEVYNYYGHKSNSELLVAYGFTLPGLQHDVVNLKVTPGPDARLLRRSQVCHSIPEPGQAEKEFMYQVRSISTQSNKYKLPELRAFSHGLVDTMACMVANTREGQYLALNQDFCLEAGVDQVNGLMSRNFVQVMYILRAKLESEIARIENPGVSLGAPQNRNQRIALDYRNRQLQVLQEAITPISRRLEDLFATNSFCHDQQRPSPDLAIDILGLECAFDWLCREYEGVGKAVTQMIAEDQEEELPLNWAVLVEDWDHTYWVVWVWLVGMLRQRDLFEFKNRHSRLVQWLSNREATGMDSTTLYAEPGEEETINSMIQGIVKILQPEPADHEQNWKRSRNFASYIVHEESIRASLKHDGKEVPQELLCITTY